MRNRKTAVYMILLCLSILFAGGQKSEVFAAEDKEETKQFTGSVEMLKKDNKNYVMQVTAENAGEDFTGTVQVIFTGSGFDNCAYNTELTLPAEGKKQFTITVPERAADTVRGICELNFLNEKGKMMQSISLKNVFGNSITGIPVGILSDHYTDLGFMDAGGENFYIKNNMEYPLKLIELNKDNLQEYLDGLYFLVIDRFNVSALGEENIQAVQKWVADGGWLLIGTGAYADQTLSGFDEDFLGIEVLDISEPGEENEISSNNSGYGYYYDYKEAGIDFSQMEVAKLDYGRSHFYESAEQPAVCGAVGDGAASVFYFSFGEKELQKLETYMVSNLYSETMYRSNSYSHYGGFSNMDYTGQRLLSYIDSSNTSVDFTWLEALIGVYVVLVGPVMYLILRKCKKSEWYWIGVPALGLIFIAGVFFFGQGSKVNETKVYSVTAKRADSNQEDTYFLAYHSGIKEWRVSLNDKYEIAGPGFNGSGYYGVSTTGAGEYRCIVSNDSEGMSIGLKPKENFENGYFYASGRSETSGAITGSNISGIELNGDPQGTITNGTDYDMAYMAVWSDSYILVYSDVKAGETVDLQQADNKCVYKDEVKYYDTMVYDLANIYGYRTNDVYERDDMSALVLGLGIAEETKPSNRPCVIIAGLVKDYEKAAAGRCSEISYGCLYSYAETEER